MNVLSADQQTLAAHFANGALPIDERFAAAQWDTPRDVREVGTHTVFFCAVKAARTHSAGDALIYYGRRYHRVGERSAAEMLGVS